MRIQNLENEVETSKLIIRWRPQNSQPGGDLKTQCPLEGGDLKPCPGSQAPAEGLQQSASKGIHGRQNIRKYGT